MTELVITYGLPGSGKTSLSKKLYNNHIYIDMDCIQRSNNNNADRIKEQLIYQLKYNKTRDKIIDGLITTNESLLQVIKIAKSIHDYQIKVIVLREDRENSLLNDEYRNRNQKARKSIETMPYDKIDESLFKKVNFYYYDTYRLKEYEKLAIRYNVCSNNEYLFSESWCLGGIGNSYTGDTWGISSEEEKEFIELDNLLETVKPDITYLRYKKLIKECVTKEKIDTSDYYENSTSMRWKCDLEKFFNFLEISL